MILADFEIECSTYCKHLPIKTQDRKSPIRATAKIKTQHRCHRKLDVKRYQGLMRDSWPAWILICLFGIVLGIVKHPLFFSAIPIGVFAFLYFGLMRYDENGNAKEGM